MAITVTCDGCEKSFTARPEFAGKRVRCPHCKEPVAVPSEPADESPDDAPTARPAGRGSVVPWLVAGGAGVLFLGALVFGLTAHSQRTALRGNLATAEQEAQSLRSSGDELARRTAAADERAKAATAKAEQLDRRLTAAEKDAKDAKDAGEALRKELAAKEAAPPPAAPKEPRPRGGTITRANSNKRAFAEITGSRYETSLTPGGPGRAVAVPGEVLMTGAEPLAKGGGLNRIVVRLDTVKTIAVAAKAERDPRADNVERIYSVEVAYLDGTRETLRVQAPLAVFIRWSGSGAYVEHLNQDMLGLTFTFDDAKE